MRTRVVSVCAGANHTLAISEAGQLWSCGRGRHGQLGHGHFHDEGVLTLVEAIRCGWQSGAAGLGSFFGWRGACSGAAEGCTACGRPVAATQSTEVARRAVFPCSFLPVASPPAFKEFPFLTCTPCCTWLQGGAHCVCCCGARALHGAGGGRQDLHVGGRQVWAAGPPAAGGARAGVHAQRLEVVREGESLPAITAMSRTGPGLAQLPPTAFGLALRTCGWRPAPSPSAQTQH